MAIPPEETERLLRKARFKDRNDDLLMFMAMLFFLPFAWHAYGSLWSFAEGLF